MLILRTEGIFARQSVEELLLDQIRRKFVREDNVVVNTAQMVLTSAKLVQPQFNNRQEQINILEAALGPFSQDALVSIQKDVIVDPNDFELGREMLQFKVIG